MAFNGKEINSKEIAKPSQSNRPNPYKGDVIYSPRGQWDFPGHVTRIPGENITMKGVSYPVLGVDDQGNEQMMMPGGYYTFPGAANVTEYPQMMYGGDPSLPAITGHYQKGGTKIHANKVAYDKAYKAEKDSMYLYNHPKPIQSPTSWDYGKNNPLVNAYGMRSRGIDPVAWDRSGDEFSAVWKKPIMHNVYQEPIEQPKKAEDIKKDYATRNVDFSSPYGAVMKYYDELGQVLKTEPYILPAKQSGGDVEKARAFLQDGSIYGHPLTQAQIEYFTRIAGPMDDQGEFESFEEDLGENTEEMRRGGISPLQRMVSPRRHTSKNIKSSINKLFLRNHDLFGPAGRNIYDSKSKYRDGGGWLDEYQEGGTSNKMKMSNDEIVQAVQAIHDDPNNEYKIRGNVNETDWNRINSLFQSPQGQKLTPRSHDNWNLLMPDNQGSYTDSGVSPFDLMLGAPQDVVKAIGTKVVKGLSKGTNTKAGNLQGTIEDVKRTSGKDSKIESMFRSAFEKITPEQMRLHNLGVKDPSKRKKLDFDLDAQDEMINRISGQDELTNALMTGYTDSHQFNKELQYFKDQAQYGKRPLENSLFPVGDIKNTTGYLSDKHFDYEMYNPQLLKKYGLTSKMHTPYTGKQAFQQLTPNKYGGQQKGWLDDYE